MRYLLSMDANGVLEPKQEAALVDALRAAYARLEHLEMMLAARMGKPVRYPTTVTSSRACSGWSWAKAGCAS